STLIRASFGPGTGTGTSSIHRPLAVSRLTSAFMVADIMGRPAATGSLYRLQRKPRARGNRAGARRGGWRHSVSHLRWSRAMRLPLPCLSVAIAMSIAPAAGAVEGMWVPQQLPEISAPLKQAGLKLDPAQLADLTGDPLGAVVSLGGCTASFVSPQGLVVTNHHCAYGAIQLNSTPGNNLMRDGFNAAAPADEITAGPNARIYVLDAITDVTGQVRAAIDAASDPLGRTR